MSIISAKDVLFYYGTMIIKRVTERRYHEYYPTSRLNSFRDSTPQSR